ncbi:MAG: zinc-regulated TonB-dependent outer membrane receptor [Deltaproteobacteria bacterium]|nr:zinc-regulated TonB-dependent outer membrane receptor [Deltaproteobacteria bacterium]MCB9789184.1 zinc-regulated TonB-dependent outer membrane receptor [Deltaproteobacteria bacterium]
MSHTTGARSGLAVGLFASLLFPPITARAAPPPDPPSADELRQLEEGLAADAAEAPPPPPATAEPAGTAVGRFLQSMNPDIALILDVALAAFSDRNPLQVGAHDPTGTGFTFQQLELSMGSNVGPFFRLDTNIVFSQFGVEVEEAYGTTLALPGHLQIRAGQFLTRFGRINATHPHTWSFVDQPLVLGKFFGGEGNRGLGVEVSWLTPLPWYVELIATAGQADGACCSRSYYGADNPGVDGVEDFLYTFAVKQFFPLSGDLGLSLGLSAQLGPNASGNRNRTDVYGMDLYLRWRPADSTRRMALSLQLEAMFRSRQVPGDVLQDGGGFAQLVWNIDPEWEIGARYELVSGISDDPLDPDWSGLRQRGSLEATFYPSHFSRIRLQGGLDDPSWRSAPIWSAVLSLELVIGAHGAHRY